MSTTRTASSRPLQPVDGGARQGVVAAEQAAAGDAEGWHKGQADEALLKPLIEDHHRWTGSLRARDILDHWAETRGTFVKVFPHEYKRALGQRSAAEHIRKPP